MQIIPVIDLKEGLVVHARGGNRSLYQPVHRSSALIRHSSEPQTVLDSLMSFYPFRTIYIADLNAIIGHGDHAGQISDLARLNPTVEFWIDSGCCQTKLPIENNSNCITVLGSESQQDAPDATHLQKAADFILSLDFKLNSAIGHPDWFERSDLWPDRIILMTLGHIGANAGPDFDKMNWYTSKYEKKYWVAAGGVRHVTDLRRLAESGGQAALIASALHAGSLTPMDIENLQAKKYPG
jgi:phosphoribosylformimino-5-aminoimidazole carboxamide ribotide isomerase